MDHLKLALKSAKHDTVKCEILMQLIENENDDLIWPTYNKQLQVICQSNLKKVTVSSHEYPIYTRFLASSYSNQGYLAGETGNLDSSLKYNQLSVDVLQSLLKITKSKELINQIKIDIATSLNNIAINYTQLGDAKQTIKYFEKSLKIQEELNDKVGIARSLSNLAFIYDKQGDIPKALEYNHKSLKIKESIGDKDGISNSFNNMGTIYVMQNELDKALTYFNKAYKIQKEINNRNGMPQTLSNIGFIYLQKGDTAVALKYYTNGLNIANEINDKQGFSTILDNMGGIYHLLAKQSVSKFESDSLYDLALSNYEKALTIQTEIENKAGIVTSLINITEIYENRGNIKLAKKYGEKAFKLAKEISQPFLTRQVSGALSKIYKMLGDYKPAYEMLALHKLMADSINNESTKKATLQKSFQYEYDKKAAADSVRISEERKVVTIQLEKEKTQRLALYIGIVLIAVFSLFMYNRFRVTRKQKLIIEDQNIEVDKQRRLADSRRILAEEQREVIQEKQKEILDSIHYAKRIQQALLTGETYISEHFSAECFIFYQPKDIVSGDFYWAAAHHNRFYIATADCTGHGVPGAFMSLLNINFLNENVIERGIKHPSDILTEQRKEIIKSLNPKGDENSKDGMDCVLCAFDLENNQLEFAAANNPLWLVRNKELTEYKADKMPVGKGEDNAKDFRNQIVELQKGDIIYTFTDGFADQFGGPKGKKYKYKQLKDLFLANAHKSMGEQKELLSKSLNDWKGEQEQVDDILVIGVKI